MNNLTDRDNWNKASKRIIDSVYSDVIHINSIVSSCINEQISQVSDNWTVVVPSICNVPRNETSTQALIDTFSIKESRMSKYKQQSTSDQTQLAAREFVWHLLERAKHIATERVFAYHTANSKTTLLSYELAKHICYNAFGEFIDNIQDLKITLKFDLSHCVAIDKNTLAQSNTKGFISSDEISFHHASHLSHAKLEHRENESVEVNALAITKFDVVFETLKHHSKIMPLELMSESMLYATLPHTNIVVPEFIATFAVMNDNSCGYGHVMALKTNNVIIQALEAHNITTIQKASLPGALAVTITTAIGASCAWILVSGLLKDRLFNFTQLLTNGI